jgi:chitodextrinase
MNDFTSAITAGLHGFGQKLWCNKGSSHVDAGAAAWRALDASANPPDVMAEEGAFAVAFGPWATQFFPEANWKNQVDVMGAVKNSKVAMFSHTQLAEGGTGTDNWGQTVTYWQTLWYALGSFLLGKNDVLNNAYFGFFGNGASYDRIWWYNEYDDINLGKALGSYTVTPIAGVNVYAREFEKGYVLVNPTPNNVASVTLPQPVQQLTHDNLLSALSTIPIVSAIPLNAHNAVILLKTVVAPTSDTIAPTTPAGLSASAVSSSQINLAWTASTDNVAVTGYRVYRGGVPLTTLGAVTTLQDTGLSPSTAYSYTVQAIDAAGNASAQSAAASASTASPADTTAPSAPTGLTASAVSPSQISLSWTASTDNVAVTGYRVYRGGSLLVTLGAVASLQNTGLSPSTSYSYTVQAIDAAGNASAQSAAASATTPAASDTAAPSVPTGLKATAVSGTQVKLNWNASTDNVHVTGYTVYLNNAILATTTGTSFQHTGLTPGATYSYRVSAFDAAGNNSAWTPTPVSVKTPKRRITAGDFDGDGKSDVLWRNAATGANAMWLMNGATITSGTTFSTVADSTWGIAGVGDFDGDGKADILWRNITSGGNLIWLMNGAAVLGQAAVNPVTDLSWSVAGVGDFDGDGKTDILWVNNTTGAAMIWLMNGGATAAGAVPFATVADLNWGIVGVGDFDGDGKADILLRNRATGDNLLWVMNGTTITSTVSVSPMPDLTWTVAGTGDFDGDGKADILWRNTTTGQDAIWFMNAATIVSGPLITTTLDLGWSIAGTGDFDGDGKADILWRNAANGQDAIWLMNGATVASGPFTGTVADASWSIAFP